MASSTRPRDYQFGTQWIEDRRIAVQIRDGVWIATTFPVGVKFTVAVPGVYFYYRVAVNGDLWVAYVGETDSVARRHEEHLRERYLHDHCVTHIGYVWVEDKDVRLYLEGLLAWGMQPPLNAYKTKRRPESLPMCSFPSADMCLRMRGSRYLLDITIRQ